MTVAYVPDRLANDETFSLKMRLFVELQRRGAALDWTPPLATTDLATHFNRSRRAIYDALRALKRGKYIESEPVSLPKGGRGSRYRVRLENTVEQKKAKP